MNTNLVTHWNTESNRIPKDKEHSRYAVEKEALFSRHSVICDIGCGTGADTLYFLNNGHRVIGIDISDAALKVAKERTQQYREKASFYQVDLSEEKIPLQNMSVNVVYARLSLHYFSKKRTQEIFTEIYRILKSPAHAYITLKSPLDMEEMNFLENNALKKDEGVYLDKSVLKSRYSKNELETFLTDAYIPSFSVSSYEEDVGKRKDIIKSGKEKLLLNEIILHKS